MSTDCEAEITEIPEIPDVTEAQKNNCYPATSVRIISGALSMIFGIALFCTATVWFANIEAGKLRGGICVAFAFGIFSGIFQFGSTQILCLLGIKSKWKIFVWFTLASFTGSMIVFLTSILLYSNPPEETNATDIQPELQAVIVVSGLNCAFTGIFVTMNLLSKAWRMRKASQPYTLME